MLVLLLTVFSLVPNGAAPPAPVYLFKLLPEFKDHPFVKLASEGVKSATAIHMNQAALDASEIIVPLPGGEIIKLVGKPRIKVITGGIRDNGQEGKEYRRIWTVLGDKTCWTESYIRDRVCIGVFRHKGRTYFLGRMVEGMYMILELEKENFPPGFRD